MLVYFESVRVSVLFFPLVAVLLFVPLWIKHKVRFGELHEYRASILYAFVFYFMVACLLTVLPLPRDTDAFCALHNSVPRRQLVPFASFSDIATYAQNKNLGWSLGDIAANRALWQVLFNVLLLLPFGFLLRALYGMRLIYTGLLALALSLLLELTQLTGVWGLAPCPYRLFDVDDLLTNTIGAMLGWSLLPLFKWLPSPRLQEDNLWYRRKPQKKNISDKE